jgi:hypothetical protein
VRSSFPNRGAPVPGWGSGAPLLRGAHHVAYVTKRPAHRGRGPGPEVWRRGRHWRPRRPAPTAGASRSRTFRTTRIAATWPGATWPTRPPMSATPTSGCTARRPAKDRSRKPCRTASRTCASSARSRAPTPAPGRPSPPCCAGCWPRAGCRPPRQPITRPRCSRPICCSPCATRCWVRTCWPRRPARPPTLGQVFPAPFIARLRSLMGEVPGSPARRRRSTWPGVSGAWSRRRPRPHHPLRGNRKKRRATTRREGEADVANPTANKDRGGTKTECPESDGSAATRKLTKTDRTSKGRERTRPTKATRPLATAPRVPTGRMPTAAATPSPRCWRPARETATAICSPRSASCSARRPMGATRSGCRCRRSTPATR